MFRGRVRMHTCKIILLTSFVWFLLDIALLVLFSDSSASAPQKSALHHSHSNTSHHTPGKSSHHVDNSLPGSVEVNRNWLCSVWLFYKVIWYDLQGFEFPEKYAPHQLKRWKPVPVVPEKNGSPGEMGRPVQLPPDQESLMREKFRLNQFNLLASDSISLNRSLPDVRLEG